MGNSHPVTAVIIPWRDRGIDPLRSLNLMRVLEHWEEFEAAPFLVGDGRHGTEQFNRHAAYNRGIALADAGVDVYVFAEGDMLIPPKQIYDAVMTAFDDHGLVVPFTEYRYLSPKDSLAVCAGDLKPEDAEPQWVMADGKAIGAVSVVSRRTMDAVGQWDEVFEGNWFDDDASKIAFDICTAPTRWVEGPAYHLHHLPGHAGHHLTPEDHAATRRNKRRLRAYRAAQTPQRIRELTAGGQ
jgi:hypothetical protein